MANLIFMGATGKLEAAAVGIFKLKMTGGLASSDCAVHISFLMNM